MAELPAAARAPGQRAVHGDKSWVVPEALRWRPGERQAWHRASLGLRTPRAEELDSGRQPLPFHVPLLTGHLICPPNADPSPATHLCLYFYKLFITGSSAVYQGRESSIQRTPGLLPHEDQLPGSCPIPATVSPQPVTLECASSRQEASQGARKAPEDRGLIPGLVPLLADSQCPVTEGAFRRWLSPGGGQLGLRGPIWPCLWSVDPTAGSPEGL